MRDPDRRFGRSSCLNEMSLTSLLEIAAQNERLAAVRDALRSAGGTVDAYVSASLRPYLLAALIGGEDGAAPGPVLIVAADDRSARDLAGGLNAFLAPPRVHMYPSRGTTYESHLDPPPHLAGLRIAAMNALGSTGRPIVVASAIALAEKVPDPALRPESLALHTGESVDLDDVTVLLADAGYDRVDQVEERGQFAVRGGILDVYPATEEQAIRVELFGDEIESIRRFSVFTQRSLGDAERVELAPAAEISAEHRDQLMRGRAAAEGEARPVHGAFIAPLDLVPTEALVVLASAEEIPGALHDHWEDVTGSIEEKEARELYADVAEPLEARASLSLGPDAGQEHSFRAQRAEFPSRTLAEAEGELEKLTRSGYRSVVAFEGRGEAERTRFNLSRLDVPFLGEAAPRDAGGSFAAAIELRVGDYVVHEDHGVARFSGFDTKTLAGVTRDYLELEYRGGDRVFAPTDQLARISRYVGADGDEPALSPLGGKRWPNMKSRARRAAHAMAGELINLYAERQVRRGHAFPPDGGMQIEFEAAFPYRETADQLDAIEAVKADMESERPMDRLICGDVGYGKTEIALRASFKAANAGKQVLMLVPTTILAQQHYGTFSERLRDYPFTIEHVSRFRPAAEQRAAVKRFADGKVDILIGTHRVLSRDVRAKDLGLIIVDEEQRFGVKQKELLRQLKLRVDVISMSATPIPRTLQMSLAGIRDISVIETPPEGRRPVKTYVGEYDEALVKQALLREKERGGQAFFVHNRVETIDETAERLRGLCPGVRFEVVHGQMDEKMLERRMLDFLRGDADVLVATSIIESGIDIPQANTLIIERADIFGLAQLYQIRGRVGRSPERAYAYLLYPSAAALTEEATKRLSALSDYTELGAGFKIAMRDLEIRGAGNLLGDEQSGHVAALGFELYLAMLDEAVLLLAGDAAEEAAEPVRMDLPVDAYVPGDYVPYEAAKIEIHRRVAGAREIAQLIMLREELAARFGPIPDALENLIKLQDARIKLGRAGARAVDFRGERMAVSPIE